MTRIALLGNPNCGKTTLFNRLTGSNQKVGNWPGVTISKTQGQLLGHPESVVVDLPGIYSLSPYTTEEIVSRDFLLDDRPDMILNIVDGTQLERSLYLTTQLLELEIPMVIAINMVDLFKQSGMELDEKALEKILKVPVIPISAYRNQGIDQLIQQLDQCPSKGQPITFSPIVEEQLLQVTQALNRHEMSKFWAIKYFERDQKMIEKDCAQADCALINLIIAKSEQWLDSDSEAIITSERYDWIETVMESVKHHVTESIAWTDRIDEWVTHRWLGIPIFLLVMYLVYYLSIATVGTLGTDWVNEVLFGQMLPESLTLFLQTLEVDSLVISLVVDGILAGVGAILGFLPQMAMLFLCLAVLEDCGYMARIAFVMDRLFNKFGLSGKSFIPLLVGSGCSVPGIQASRTIENEQNRQLTILTTSFIPCSAKLPVIALIANALFGGSQWVAFAMYLLGIGSVLISSLLLKKVLFGNTKPSPFVMELPAYRLPSLQSIIKVVWLKLMSFVKRAGSVIFLSSCCIWFLTSFNWQLQWTEAPETSLLANLGNIFAPLFIPLGFGNWQSVAATIQGLIAKENIVATLGVIQGLSETSLETSPLLFNQLAVHFNPISGLSFLIFNMLCMPCFAAVGAMRAEFNQDRLAIFAVCYQMFYAYLMAFITYQLGLFFYAGFQITFETLLASLFLLMLILALILPNPLVYHLTHPFSLQRKEQVS